MTEIEQEIYDAYKALEKAFDKLPDDYEGNLCFFGMLGRKIQQSRYGKMDSLFAGDAETMTNMILTTMEDTPEITEVIINAGLTHIKNKFEHDRERN